MPDHKGMSRAKRGSLSRPFCEVCGYTRFSTRHRILPRKKGGVYTEGNVINLCGNCHWEADREWIPSGLLLEIVEARLKWEQLSGKQQEIFEDSRPAQRSRQIAEEWGSAAKASCGCGTDCCRNGTGPGVSGIDASGARGCCSS